MSLLIFAIIVIIVVAMLVYAVDFAPLAAPFNNLVKLLIILVGVLLIINRAGVL